MDRVVRLSRLPLDGLDIRAILRRYLERSVRRKRFTHQRCIERTAHIEREIGVGSPDHRPEYSLRGHQCGLSILFGLLSAKQVEPNAIRFNLGSTTSIDRFVNRGFCSTKIGHILSDQASKPLASRTS